MKSLLCRPSVCQASGQIQLHEKRQLAGWVRGSGGSVVRVHRLRWHHYIDQRGGKPTLALPTECTEEPLLTRPPLKLSLMH